MELVEILSDPAVHGVLSNLAGPSGAAFFGALLGSRRLRVVERVLQRMHTDLHGVEHTDLPPLPRRADPVGR